MVGRRPSAPRPVPWPRVPWVRPPVAAGTVGAVAGGAAGRAISGGDTRAVELTVRLDSGRTIAVVQPGSVNDYRVGDRARGTNDGTTTRVAR